MADIQEIYNRLLASGYQRTLFSDLKVHHTEKAGRETLASCPFCHDPEHFSYSSVEPVWKCWKCEEAGDWLKYLEKAKRLSFLEALQSLAREAGVEVSGADSQQHEAYTRKAGLLEAAQGFLIKALQMPDGRPVLEYLQARGYTPEEIQAMELGAYVGEGPYTWLRSQDYSDKEIREAGLLTKGFGEDYTLTLLWRDASGRAIGIAARSLLSREELKARDLQPYKYSFGLQKSQGLIGLERARGAREVLLVEGVLDALYLSSRGLAVVAVGGKSISAAQIKALEASGAKDVLLALDRDKPGQDATAKAIQELRASTLRPYVVSLPEGYKDPDELVRSQGLQPLKQAMAKADGWPAWLAGYTVSQFDLTTARGLDQALEASLSLHHGIEDRIEARAFLEALLASTGLSEADIAPRLQEHSQRASEKAAQEALQGVLRRAGARASEGDVIGAELELSGGLQAIRKARGVKAPEPYLVEDAIADLLSSSEGLSTGYEGLDKAISIPQGAITIVAGRPGHGKTTFLMNLLIHLIQAYPERRFYFFSYEEAKARLFLKLLIILAGRELNREFNQQAYLHYLREKREQDQAIEKALACLKEWMASGRLWLMDSRLSGEDLASTIGYLASSGPVGAVVVDYIQKIPLAKPLQGQRYLEIKKVSELLLEQAVLQDIPIIMGAQFGRSGETGKKVRLDNLRESGDIEQDASLVLGLLNTSVDQVEEQGKEDRSKSVELEVSVLKNRAGMAGHKTTLLFERAVLRLKDGPQGQW